MNATHAIGFPFAAVAAGLMAASTLAKPRDSALDIACEVHGNHVVVDFKGLRHPTYFGIRTPDDRFVYLRYPPEAIDVLGEAYRKDRLELDIQTLTGYALHDGRKRPVRVFSTGRRV